MSKHFKIASLVASLFPLWLCVIIRYLVEMLFGDFSFKWAQVHIYLLIIIGIFLILSGVCNILCLVLFRDYSKHKNGRLTYRINSYSRRKNYTIDFLLSFIIPLLAFFSSSAAMEKIVGLITSIVYIAIIGVIYYKNNSVFSNIFFELFGYKFYEANVSFKMGQEEKSSDVLIISRKDEIQDLEDLKDITKDILVLWSTNNR